MGYGSRDYYLDPAKFSKNMDAYKKYQLQVLKFVLAGADVPYIEQQLVRDVNDALALEIEIAKVTSFDCFKNVIEFQ